jgi:hypothetical protein
MSLRDALRLGHSYICTEHMLLGIIRARPCVAADVLMLFGADLNDLRRRVERSLPSGPASISDPYRSDRRWWYGLEQLNPLQTRRQGHSDRLLLKLLWNAKMIREPQDAAERSYGMSCWSACGRHPMPTSGRLGSRAASSARAFLFRVLAGRQRNG